MGISQGHWFVSMSEIVHEMQRLVFRTTEVPQGNYALSPDLPIVPLILSRNFTTHFVLKF